MRKNLYQPEPFLTDLPETLLRQFFFRKFLLRDQLCWHWKQARRRPFWIPFEYISTYIKKLSMYSTFSTIFLGAYMRQVYRNHIIIILILQRDANLEVVFQNGKIQNANLVPKIESRVSNILEANTLPQCANPTPYVAL